MSTTSEHYSLPGRPKARLRRTRDAESSPRARGADGTGAIPIMGPANRAPGTPIMGDPVPALDVMGGADAGPRLSVMGPSDRGSRLDLFGETDLRFVDSLFTTLPTKEHQP
jgi:hypothetical protein